MESGIHDRATVAPPESMRIPLLPPQPLCDQQRRMFAQYMDWILGQLECSREGNFSFIGLNVADEEVFARIVQNISQLPYWRYMGVVREKDTILWEFSKDNRIPVAGNKGYSVWGDKQTEYHQKYVRKDGQLIPNPNPFPDE